MNPTTQAFPNSPGMASIAAIVHQPGDDADAVLAAFVHRQRAAGWCLRGLLQLPSMAGDGGSKRMQVVDLDDPGCPFTISQELGLAARGCNLDPGGVASASAVLRRVRDAGADLAIANRFGTLEAEGKGLTAEIIDLLAAGIPLLTVVKDRHLAAWRSFSGGTGRELAAHAAALDDWFASLVRKPQ